MRKIRGGRQLTYSNKPLTSSSIDWYCQLITVIESVEEEEEEESLLNLQSTTTKPRPIPCLHTYTFHTTYLLFFLSLSISFPIRTFQIFIGMRAPKARRILFENIARLFQPNQLIESPCRFKATSKCDTWESFLRTTFNLAARIAPVRSSSADRIRTHSCRESLSFNPYFKVAGGGKWGCQMHPDSQNRPTSPLRVQARLSFFIFFQTTRRRRRKLPRTAKNHVHTRFTLTDTNRIGRTYISRKATSTFPRNSAIFLSQWLLKEEGWIIDCTAGDDSGFDI